MKRIMMSLAAIALLVLSQAVVASTRRIAEGSQVTLAPGEGLLLLGVDTPDRMDSLRFNRPDHFIDGNSLDDVRPGLTFRLFAVSAGAYKWSDIEYYTRAVSAKFTFGDDSNFQFEVKPGVVNYPGTLLHFPRGMRVSVRIADRGITAMDWLQEHFPVAYRGYPFVYAGRYPDTFPAFYRQASAAMPAGFRGQTASAPDPGVLPIPIADLWRDERIGVISLSPDESLLAEEIVEDGKRRIDLIDLKVGSVRSLVNVEGAVESIVWAGNRDFAVTLDGIYRFGTAYFVRLKDDGKGGFKADAVRVPDYGRIVHVFRDEPGVVLFESDAPGGGVMVHRIDMNGLSSLLEMRLSPNHRIDKGVPDATRWFADIDGKLRAAWVYRNDKYQVLYGADGNYEVVFEFDPKGFNERGFLGGDGKTLYFVTDHDRAQRELVAFDTTTRKTTTVFSKPGIDVENPLFGPSRNLTGVSYFENGDLVKEYFDPNLRKNMQRIAAAFPGASVRVEEFGDTFKRFIVSVQASDRPRRLYLYDVDKSTAELIDDAAPWFEGRRFASSRTIRATGSGGVPIEAYLTMPVTSTGKVPLIVYSHGGPIGVRDERSFDPAVQLFASLGYAVLQVNFRGSDGYGRTFREAGMHHFGGLIEDDVDVATKAVLRYYPIDEQRICAVGSSYGGYSALISAIRWPQRIRCVVSISGVTDQELMFTASDSALNDTDRKKLEEIVGKPSIDGDDLRAHAPVFRYADLVAPVMLAHGTDDARVDIENSLRLARMLAIAGRPPVMMTLKGEGHGGFESKNEIALWSAVAGFLRKYLDVRPRLHGSGSFALW